MKVTAWNNGCHSKTRRQPQIDVQQSELLAKVGAARLSTVTNTN